MDDVKETYISSIQAEKGKDKIFIRNCRPILLLNVDHKVSLKALAKRLKIIFQVLISREQTAYVKDG